MNRILLLSVILLAFSGTMTKKAESKKEDLPNFYKINETFYRGGQPTESGVKQLAERGIKTIVNLRGKNNNHFDKEETWAKANGIKYIHVPLSNWFASSDEKIQTILDEIQKPENQPVFVHCKRGADRTGTVTAVYRMKYENWTAKDANDEARKFGIGWWQVWMKDYIKDYYGRLKK
jgi:protein tyrosine/serine phosphatase